MESIQTGATAIGTIVNAGAEIVGSGGTASSTIVNQAGGQYVYSGGLVSGTTINPGGGQVVLAGGIASATTVKSGGTEAVYGSAINPVIQGGAVLAVLSGGTVSNATISSGAAEIVSGGSSSVSFVYGGTVSLIAGTTLYTFLNDAVQTVGSGAVASNTGIRNTIRSVRRGGGRGQCLQRNGDRSRRRVSEQRRHRDWRNGNSVRLGNKRNCQQRNPTSIFRRHRHRHGGGVQRYCLGKFRRDCFKYDGFIWR